MVAGKNRIRNREGEAESFVIAILGRANSHVPSTLLCLLSDLGNQNQSRRMKVGKGAVEKLQVGEKEMD